MTIETLVVPAVGIGRRDYSQSIEFASYATMKGIQGRMQLTSKYTLPTLLYPDFYVSLYRFLDLAGAVVYAAPDIPYHIYSVECSGETEALMIAGLYRFNTYGDIWIWNVDEWYGDVYGYGKVKLQYSKGIRTVQGKYYVSALAQWPDTSFRLTGVIAGGPFNLGEVVTGDISGATGLVSGQGVDWIVVIGVVGGPFSVGDTVTGAGSGATIGPPIVIPTFVYNEIDHLLREDVVL